MTPASANGELGSRRVELAAGPIHYREWGSGPIIVFVHGLLVNGGLWRKVAPPLAESHRCIVPELPLGSHPEAMKPDADLSPPGLARLIVDFLEALDLDDVTLVANDTGGALSQLVVTSHPQRIGRLVLTPCDAYDNFLPPMFRPLQWAARVPGGLLGFATPLRLAPLRRLPMAFGWLAKRPIDRDASDSYVRPALTDREVRRDVVKVLRGISSRYTLDAAARFSTFTRPVLLAWAREDRFFPLEHARRMAASFPDARLVEIDDSYSFVPEDQPERLATLIAEFVAERVSSDVEA
jgi:pimeloyl-ACP methyl ester carboxylesterase